MDPITQKRFDEIVAKDISAITKQDLLFLNSRSAYLTEEQRVKYAKVIGASAPDKKPKEDKLAVFRDLMKQAKAKGLKVPKGTKIDELKLMLS